MYGYTNENWSSGDTDLIQSAIDIHAGYAEDDRIQADLVHAAPFCRVCLEKSHRQAQ